MLTAPLSSDEVVLGCVTENTPKFLGQTLRLLQSIRWFGGSMAGVRVVVGAVERIDRRARAAFEALGAEVRVVARFHPRNPSGNRLQIFPELRAFPERHDFLLDCDTIVVRDPLPLLIRGVFQAKIAPFPTVTHEAFERLFAHFGLPLPPRTYRTGYSGTPTIPYFNAGVISIPAELAERLAPEWRRFNAILADEPTLAAPCQRHLHQAALSLALAASGIPVAEAGAELNYQLNATMRRTPPGYADVDPCIIHYHDLVDGEGLLLPCPFPRAQQRIDAFNARLGEERARAMMRGRATPRPSSSTRQIVVLGAPGSGLSLVAQLLGAMGADAGENAPDALHPFGGPRRRDVVALHDELPRRNFAQRAAAILRKLDAQRSAVICEPRMALLFPLWRDALERPLCVLVWREPHAVARSLGLPIPVGLALWEEATRAMLASTAGLPRILVSYDALDAAALHRQLVAAGAADLVLPPDGDLIIPAAADEESEGGLDESQRELLDALRSGAALQWDVVAPPPASTLAILAEHRRNAAAAARAERRRRRVMRIRRAVSRVVRRALR